VVDPDPVSNERPPTTDTHRRGDAAHRQPQELSPAGELGGLQISPETLPAIHATHDDLSPLAGGFLRYLLEHSEVAWPVAFEHPESLPEWVRRYPYRWQLWPVLVDVAKRRQIERATVGVERLIKSIPERIFGGDPRRLCEFYGRFDPGLMGLLLEPPNGIATALSRCDFIDDGSAFKCIELNISAFLGGWQHRFFERACRTLPPLADFLASTGARACFRDSWREGLAFIVDHGHREGHAASGNFNLAVVVDDENVWGESLTAFDDLFQEVLRDSGTGVVGHALRCSNPADLTARGGVLYYQGEAVSAVIEFTSKPTPRDVYRCFRAGRLALYNGPLSPILGDKRNLALLSQHEESDLWSAEERHLIADHIPWSRALTDEYTTWHGERIRLVDFACAHRSSLVLKPAVGSSGIDVHIGSVTEPPRWRSLLDDGAGKRTMVLQEFLVSRPYLFQLEEAGAVPHQVVWGTFSFGGTYGGGFLRMIPVERGPTVINSARGATEGLIFEV
jgi:hypothetical protein